MTEKTGKAIVFVGPGKPLEAREFPLPDELEPGAALVRTNLATVCGSDMHTWRGRRPFPTPAILGHEAVGTIVKLGLVAGPGLVVLYLGGLWFLTRLRLSRERYGEITRGLAERGSRGAGS